MIAGMDDVVARLEADPAVRALVAGALERTGGDVGRAVRLMQLRLARGRREDAAIFAGVVGGALWLAAANEGQTPAPTLRERSIGLCDRSRAAVDRSRWIRGLTAELLASVRTPHPVAAGG
jgi:hypothetical protein